MTQTILIIEDNEKNIILETDLLELAGFKVLQATTAKVGIELAIAHKPAVIVLDVRLPDMRGTEVIKVLRATKETENIPVAFVTSSVMTEGIKELLTIPNSVYLSKPIDTHNFAQQVSQLIKTKS